MSSVPANVESESSGDVRAPVSFTSWERSPSAKSRRRRRGRSRVKKAVVAQAQPESKGDKPSIAVVIGSRVEGRTESDDDDEV